MFTKSPNFNPNYAAKIVKLQTQVAHPNADRLLGWIVEGNRVWTNLDYSIGQTVIYFPIECEINPKILSRLNMYDSAELNEDKKTKGYISKRGRVKAIKLRGQPSEGLLLPIHAIVSASVEAFGTGETYVGIDCDFYNGEWLCRKYVPVGNKRTTAQHTIKAKEKQVQLKELIVENQFRFHKETPKLKNNLWAIEPTHIISVTYKLHGTSGVSSNVLTYRKLNLLERFLKKLGVKIVDSEYAHIYSTRKVIKQVGTQYQNTRSTYYPGNVWGIAHESIKHAVVTGITLYYEIVGYLPGGGYIQKGYDYGYLPTILDDYKINQNFGVYVYRITYTSMKGDVYEFDWGSLKEYCIKFGLNHVPELLYDTAFNIVADTYYPQPYSMVETEAWQQDFLKTLTDKYLEQDCYMCKSNKVPAEGIVIRRGVESFKLKAFAFLERESKELDSEEVNIEEQQTNE